MPYSVLTQPKRNVLTLMERMRGMSDADYLKALIAYHAAPTLLRIKPATFICPHEAARNLGKALEESIPCLERSFGVRVIALHNLVGAFPIFIYNPGLLDGSLSAMEARQLLADSGYDVAGGNVDALVAQLGEKLRDGKFPHEIGVFLGYPASGVRCFMERGGRDCCAVGCWKAYANPEQAKKCSARFQQARMRVAELILSGADMNDVMTCLRMRDA